MKKIVMFAVIGMFMVMTPISHALDLGPFGKSFVGNTNGGVTFGKNIEDQLSIGNGTFGGNTGGGLIFGGNIEDQLFISNGSFGRNHENMGFFGGNIEDQILTGIPPKPIWQQHYLFPSWLQPGK